MQVGLHDDREQGLVDPASAFEQAGEERTGAQFRDPQLQIPGRGDQRAGAMAVALGGAFRGTLVEAGSDGVGELGLDQRLVDRFGGAADPVADSGGLECVEDFEQDRLVPGPFRGTSLRDPWSVHADSRGGPNQRTQAR